MSLHKTWFVPFHSRFAHEDIDQWDLVSQTAPKAGGGDVEDEEDKNSPIFSPKSWFCMFLPREVEQGSLHFETNSRDKLVHPREGGVNPVWTESRRIVNRTLTLYMNSSQPNVLTSGGPST